MPGVGPATPGRQGTLTPDEIWNLVDYVLSLPYEPISKPPRQQQLTIQSDAAVLRTVRRRRPRVACDVGRRSGRLDQPGEFAVGKFWSLLFLLVPILGVACFAVAPVVQASGCRSDVSEHGHTIDHLFYFILWLTGVVFVATEVALFWFMWRYDGKRQSRSRRSSRTAATAWKSCWTIIPAATLLFIAIYQMNAWADVEDPQSGRRARRHPRHGRRHAADAGSDRPAVRVAAALSRAQGQASWATPDDIFVVNDLHLPVNEEILLDLKSADVLHSFFLPNLRVKQDAVPGMKIPVWFRATETGTFDLVCAELCGWGHYKMKGRVTVESREDFDKWLEEKYREQDGHARLAACGDKGIVNELDYGRFSRTRRLTPRATATPAAS